MANLRRLVINLSRAVNSATPCTSSVQSASRPLLRFSLNLIFFLWIWTLIGVSFLIFLWWKWVCLFFFFLNFRPCYGYALSSRFSSLSNDSQSLDIDLSNEESKRRLFNRFHSGISLSFLHFSPFLLNTFLHFFFMIELTCWYASRFNLCVDYCIEANNEGSLNWTWSLAHGWRRISIPWMKIGLKLWFMFWTWYFQSSLFFLLITSWTNSFHSIWPDCCNIGDQVFFTICRFSCVCLSLWMNACLLKI